MLREHPLVADAAIAGVPDDRLGEVPWAFVVVEAGAEIDTDALREWCRPRMAAYKVPAGVTLRRRAAPQRDRQAAPPGPRPPCGALSPNSD